MISDEQDYYYLNQVSKPVIVYGNLFLDTPSFVSAFQVKHYQKTRLVPVDPETGGWLHNLQEGYYYRDVLISDNLSGYSLSKTYLSQGETSLTFHAYNSSYSTKSLTTTNFSIKGQIDHAVLTHSKQDYVYGETPTFDSGDTLVTYDSDGTVINSFSGSSIADAVTLVTDHNGVWGNSKNEVDGAQTVSFKMNSAANILMSIVLYFSFSESNLSNPITTNVKTSYIWKKDVHSFDASGLQLDEIHHTNSASGTTKTTITHAFGSGDYPLSLVDDDNSKISYTDSLYYALKFSCSNAGGQTLSYQFTTDSHVWHGEPLAVDSLSITPTVDYVGYWDNGLDKFHLPTASDGSKASFVATFNDGTTETVSADSSKISFYSDSTLATALEAGTTSVSINSGISNTFYAKYTDNTLTYNGVSISKSVSFSVLGKHDYIDSLTIVSKPTIVKGNKLSKFKDSFDITANYKSGLKTTAKWANWYFKETGIISPDIDVSAKTVTIVDNDSDSGHTDSTSGETGEFVISDVTFSNPDISSIDLTDFDKAYNNQTDKINLSTVKATIHYSDAEYTNTTSAWSFPSDGAVSSDKDTLTIYCSSLASAYVNGTSALNVTMGETTQVDESVKFTAVNAFDTSKNMSKDETITVYDITDIQGIAFAANPFTDYKVGDTFLSEKDNTMITIYYLNASNIKTPKTFLLRNALRMINIYPVKGTKFTNAVTSRSIKVSSAFNSSANLTYDISVSDNSVTSEDEQSFEFRPVKLSSAGIDDNNHRFTLTDSTSHSGYVYYYQMTGYYKYGDDDYDFIYKTCTLKILGNTSSTATTNTTSDFTFNNGKSFKVDLANAYVLFDIGATEVDSNGHRIIKSSMGIAKGISDSNNAFIYGWLDMSSADNSVLVLLYDYIAPNNGESNITVRFPHYDADSVEFVDKMRYGCLFGHNNAMDRLWLFGNEDHPNMDIHSGEPNETNYSGAEELTSSHGDFSYFMARSEAKYGEGNNKIVGYDVISDSKLMVIKDHYGKEPSIYFRVPQMVQWYDWTGVKKTDVDGNALYDEEYTNSVSNSPVSGVIPNGVCNFNGDSLFIDNDNELAGLDVEGIIGDSQRQANTRSYYIDGLLRDSDMSKAIVWSSSRTMFLSVPNVGMFVSDRDSKSNNEYEWWPLDSVNPSCFAEIGGKVYMANDDGYLFLFNDGTYQDKKRIFADNGELISVQAYTEDYDSGSHHDNATIIASENVISQLNSTDEFYFKPLYESNDVLSKMFRKIASISNDKKQKIYCDSANGYLAVIDYETSRLIRDGASYYLNNKNTNTYIVSDDPTYAWESTYKLVLSEDTPDLGYSYYALYKIIDKNGNEISLKDHPIPSADLCELLEGEYRISLHSDYVSAQSFYLLDDNGSEMDITKYKSQGSILPLNGEITQYTTVKSKMVTAPLFNDSMNYFKTIWKIDISNGSNLPSDMEIGYVSNKIPDSDSKKIADVSKGSIGLSFDSLSFDKMDFDKKLVPRYYTIKRTIPRLKTICFAVMSDNPSPSVLPSIELTYTVPFPSKGSD